MNNRKHFQRGSGVFTCESCGGRTRMVSDARGVCEDCYEIAGILNSSFDGHDICEHRQEIEMRKARIEERGGHSDDAAELLDLIASATEG